MVSCRPREEARRKAQSQINFNLKWQRRLVRAGHFQVEFAASRLCATLRAFQLGRDEN